MRTLRQLLREFWIPLLLAVGWTGWRLWTHGDEPITVGTVIETFGPAFFLLSWATGQVVRVRRQARVEEGFKGVEGRLTGLVDNLEQRTQDVIDHITGGVSFCYLQFPAGMSEIMAVHEGSHPIYDASARVVDLAQFNAVPAAQPLAGNYNINIGDLIPGTVMPFLHPALSALSWSALNIFFSARNGLWTQQMRRAYPGSGAPTATKITRRVGTEVHVLLEQIPSGFSRLPNGEVDWS